MNTCRYCRYPEGYGWNDSAESNCLFAVKLDDTVWDPKETAKKLDIKLSEEEIESISNFDAGIGSDKDLTVIKRLADRLEIGFVETSQ